MSRVGKLIFIIICTLNTAHSREYIGVGFQSTKLSLDSPSQTQSFEIESDKYYSKNLNNINIFIGKKIDNNLSYEVNYFQGKTTKDNNNTGLVYTSGILAGQPLTTKSKITLQTISFDTLITLHQPQLFSIIGISYTEADFLESYNNGSTNTDKGSSIGLNIGLGVTFDITKKIEMRAKTKYTYLDSLEPDSAKLSGLKGIKDIISINLETKFNF